MRRSLIVKIVQACKANCRYFTQRRNVAGLKGFSAYQKNLGSYAGDCIWRRFAKVIIRVFGPEYLRAPNEEDTKKLMACNCIRGWPGMLGSIDCMHWT